MTSSESPKWKPLRVRITKTDATDALPLLPWPLAAVLSGIAAAIAGWIVSAGFLLVAWFNALEVPLQTLLGFATQFWLLANGVPETFDSTQFSLVPLLFSFGAILLCCWTSHYGARQASLARPGANRLSLAARVAGLTIAGYLAALALMAIFTEQLPNLGSGLTGAVIISVIGCCWGTASWFELIDRQQLPVAITQLIRGAVGALAGLAIAGAVALAIATITGAGQIEELEQGLQLEPIGSFLWGACVLAYLPNLLIWAVSWILGAGFTLGTGSLSSLSGTQLGMLPDLPIFGALPATGVGHPALLGWMLVGVLAGAGGGLLACRPRPAQRLWLCPFVSAGTGLLASIVVWVLAWASRGDLGSLRMTELGPQLFDLAMIMPALLILSASVPGLIFSLRASSTDSDDSKALLAG